MFKQLRSLVSDDNPQALEELHQKRQKHWDYVASARSRMLERTAFAREHKDDVLMVNVDGMDQAKTNIPNEPLRDKATSPGAPLPVRLMGAIAYARAWYGFWTIPQWASTSNVTLTALARIIQDAQMDGQERGLPAPHLPPRLVIQMDNTAKDNKNHFLFGFAGMLLAEGYFTEVEAHFLPVGHTHQEIDQSFSLVSKAVGEKGALDVEDLMEVANGAWKRLDYVGTDVKVQVKLSAVDDYRQLFRYESARRPTGREGMTVVDTAPQEKNMHHFAGLGTERWEDEENEVSRRYVIGYYGIHRCIQHCCAVFVVGRTDTRICGRAHGIVHTLNPECLFGAGGTMSLGSATRAAVPWCTHVSMTTRMLRGLATPMVGGGQSSSRRPPSPPLAWYSASLAPPSSITRP